MNEAYQHKTPRPGAPCDRCGLVYSRETSYVPCFEPNDTLARWMVRHGFKIKNGVMTFTRRS